MELTNAQFDGKSSRIDWSGVAILVSKLEDLPIAQAEQWVGPLLVDESAIPILECNSASDLNLVLALFEPGSIILSSTSVAEALFSPSLIKDLEYSCRTVYVNGVELRVLVTPKPSEVVWQLMEPALDRFEEIL